MIALRRILLAAWLAALLLPIATTAAYANAWEAAPWQLALAGAWLVAFVWAVAPARLFLLATLPLVFVGLAVAVADRQRSVNLIDLLAVAHTFRAGEIASALQPYAVPALLLLALLLAILAVLWRGDMPRPPRAVLAALALGGAAMAFWLPASAWRQAWPAALVGAALEARAGDVGIAAPDVADARASPRDRFEHWQALRGAPPERAETYVLVIGESVRADRMPGCGGRPQITPVPAGALLYCDVLSGSSSTHSSVPLLLSRALPGHRERVPRDASLLRAFEAVGFETFWFGVQERSIAWPDAQHQVYEPTPRPDRDVLLPLLERALARPAPRKLIVLHAYNAHIPYSDRYDHARAPFPLEPGHTGKGRPQRATLGAWWNDYDNAVDESLRFLGEVAQRLQAQPGDAFLAFTPDHAENMLDDARGLTDHALKVPTLWDTHVPLVLWANESWRSAHPMQWQSLEGNRGAALMHMDVAPTLLGAAGIAYAEPRREPVDLTAKPVPPRERFTQVRAGQTMTWQALRQEAQAR